MVYKFEQTEIMNIFRRIKSTNYEPIKIPVEFIIIHATMCDWTTTKRIFEKPESVSAHLVIDVDGSIDEVIPCLKGFAMKAWHAGKSFWKDSKEKEWEWFNAFSIGIELVNVNCEINGYTEKQYESLFEVTCQLKSIFPTLGSADRVLGHEHIAPKRKKDPGPHFDWKRFFTQCYHNQIA